MPAPPIPRLESADSAAEHIAWARSIGMSPRECARAIGWTVPQDAPWSMVAALYATEAGKIMDTGMSWWCHKTIMAGGSRLRPTVHGMVPWMSKAVEAAIDVLSQCVKHRAGMPIRQDHELTFVARNGLNAGRGLHRSNWRSA